MTTNNVQTTRAKTLLAHYLKFGLEAAGYRWDGDNNAEVADIVDNIIEAAGQTVADVILAATPAQPAQPEVAPPADASDMLRQAQESLDAYERSHAEAEEHNRHERTFQRSVAQSNAIYYAHQAQMRSAIANADALTRIASSLEWLCGFMSAPKPPSAEERATFWDD